MAVPVVAAFMAVIVRVVVCFVNNTPSPVVFVFIIRYCHNRQFMVIIFRVGRHCFNWNLAI